MNIIPLLNQDTKRFKTNSFPDPKEPPACEMEWPQGTPTCEMEWELYFLYSSQPALHFHEKVLPGIMILKYDCY